MNGKTERVCATLLLTLPLLCSCASRQQIQWPTDAAPTAESRAVFPAERIKEPLPYALEAVRKHRAEQGTNRNSRVTIHLSGGTYFLNEPLVLRPDDSGIVFAASGNEKPIISGGRRIGGWKETVVGGKKLWAAEVPEAKQGKWSFHQFWVNGERRTRARHPNKGYLSIEALPDTTPTWQTGQSRFRFREGDLKAWPSVTNAEVVAMTRWVESRLPIAGVDEKERIVSFGKRSVFQLAPGDVYYAEGAFELLDEPGEWYLDAEAGQLYYWPMPGENIRAVEAIAPVLAQIARLEGRPEKGEFVQNVEFRGITFAHAEWYFPENFHSAKGKVEVSPAPEPQVGGFSQAAIGVPGAVWGEGARNCAFTDCKFVNLGPYGLELARGCATNRILRCEFGELGAGGIKIGETAIRTNGLEQARANEISDCHIHDGGKMFHSAIGVWIGQSPDNRIEHNLIHDFYYTGISIGWTWGYDPRALASNNVIAFNHVHHIGVKSDGDGPILSDMGGIYTLGKQPGTRIVNNLWHDIAATRYGGWGIYFDEGSSGILAQSNVVYRTTHGGFHQHYGETNMVFNNIFAFARDHQLQRTRAEPHLSFTFATNIVYFGAGVLLAGDWSGDNFKMDWNDYFDTGPGSSADTLRLSNATLEQWRQRGQDVHSILADPQFVAPEEGDFRLKKTSPALKLGFQTIDLSAVGPRKEERH